MSSYGKQCHICFRISLNLKKFINRFQTINESTYRLRDCLMELTGLSPSDSLVIDSICPECELDLISAFQFRVLALAAVLKLKQLDGILPKTESDESPDCLYEFEDLKEEDEDEVEPLKQIIASGDDFASEDNYENTHEETRENHTTQRPRTEYGRHDFKHDEHKLRLSSILRCAHCPRSFPSKKNLEFHLLRKHFRNSMSHLCIICGKKYATKSDLQYHERTKHGREQTRQYICHFCDKSFNHRRSIESHLPSHTGTRNHPCSRCEMVFKTQGALYNHEQRHSTAPDQAFNCEICDAKFVQRSYYKRHMRLMHSNAQNRFMCDECGKVLNLGSGKS